MSETKTGRRFFATSVAGLIALYVLALPFTKLIYLPYFNYSVQLPEIVFVFIGLAVALDRNLRRIFWPVDIYPLDIGVIAVPVTIFLSAVVNGISLIDPEVLSPLYFAVLYFLFTRTLRDQLDYPAWILSVSRRLAELMILSFFISITFYFFGITSIELLEQKYFPSAGWWWRVEAFTMSPNMFFDMCLWPAFVLVAGGTVFQRKSDLLRLTLLSLAAISTLSKSLPLLISGIFLLFIVYRKPMAHYKKIAFTTLIIAWALILFAAKIIPLGKVQADRHTVMEQSYFGGSLIGEWKKGELFSSTQLELNRVAVLAFRDSPLTGIGPGQFQQLLKKMQERDDYPPHLPIYAPHSVYFGMLAENGLIGLLGLAVLIWGILREVNRSYKKWRSRPKRNDQYAWVGLVKLYREGTEKEKKDIAINTLQIAIGLYLINWMLQGWVMDTLYLRQFWLALVFFNLLSNYRDGVASREKPYTRIPDLA